MRPCLFYRKIRLIITEKLETVAYRGFEAMELADSYFGGVQKGKRGRGAVGKVPVMGILKRGVKVYTSMMANTRTATLLSIIRRKIEPNSIYTVAIAHTTP